MVIKEEVSYELWENTPYEVDGILYSNWHTTEIIRDEPEPTNHWRFRWVKITTITESV